MDNKASGTVISVRGVPIELRDRFADLARAEGRSMNKHIQWLMMEAIREADRLAKEPY